MFSTRVPSATTVNRLSAAVARSRSQGRPLVDLTVSNPTAVGLAYPHDELKAALASPADYQYRPDPRGSLHAREAIAQAYERSELEVHPGQLFLTSSTSEAYSILFKLLCEPGDEVLVPCPSYPLFDFLARLDLVQLVPYMLRYEGSWYIDLHHVRTVVTNRTRAIVAVNPNNPTGSYVKTGEWNALLELAEQNGLALISDEVFADYELRPGRDRVRACLSGGRALSFSLGGLSKAAAMPQLKLAWIVVNGSAALVHGAVERLEMILDTYLSVNTPVQAAAASLLAIGARLQHQVKRRVHDNLARMTALLDKTAAQPLLTEGGWSAILQLPATRSDEEWALTALDGCGVLVQPGYFYDMPLPATAVVSLLPETGVFAEGIARLLALVERTS